MRQGGEGESRTPFKEVPGGVVWGGDSAGAPMKVWLVELSVMSESLGVAMTVLRRHGGRGVREKRREEAMGK